MYCLTLARLTSLILNLNFFAHLGITGNIVINEYGDRRPDYDIQIINNGTHHTIFTYRAGAETLEVHDAINNILWSAGSPTPASGAPACGWDNEFCIEGK